MLHNFGIDEQACFDTFKEDKLRKIAETIVSHTRFHGNTFRASDITKHAKEYFNLNLNVTGSELRKLANTDLLDFVSEKKETVEIPTYRNTYYMYVEDLSPMLYDSYERLINSQDFLFALERKKNVKIVCSDKETVERTYMIYRSNFENFDVFKHHCREHVMNVFLK